MNVAYIRVSTIDQNEARQVEALKNYHIDKTFLEKASGKNVRGRKELKAMLEFIREGDTVYIKDFSRLARSTKDLLELIEIFEDKKVKLVSINENIDTGTATGKLLVSMIASINEFERTNLLERQREGIEIAKKLGKFKGRKKKDLDEDLLRELYDKWKKREITQIEIAKLMNVSRTTLFRRFKEFEN